MEIVMQTILITGVNRGIGFHLARQALSRGNKVYGSCRGLDDAEKTARLLGADFTPLIFDVTDRDAIRNAARTVTGAIDVLINNAGIIGPTGENQSTLNMDFDGFARTLAVNTLAPLAIAQIFLPHLRRSDAAKILSVSSQMAWMGYAKSDRIAYRASKAALNKVMQGLATDLAPENIPVAVIDPGWVRTDMGGAEADSDPDAVARGILDIAQSLDMARTGCFIRWTGEEREF